MKIYATSSTMGLSRLVCVLLLTIGAPLTWAGNEPNNHVTHMYDNTTPGISTNISEKICVTNASSQSLIMGPIRAQILGWLNDPSGWEQIGLQKVDFTENCSVPNIPIRFVDLASTMAMCEGAACAPIAQVAPVTATIDGHTHHLVMGIDLAVEPWTCVGVPPGGGCYWDDGYKRRVVLHEVGHVLGLDHYGPVVGVMSNDQRYHAEEYTVNPSIYEVYQARAHLDGASSPALLACVGFPTTNRVVTTWFDTANDENQHLAQFQKQVSGTWTDIVTKTAAAHAGIGAKVLLNSGDRADIAGGAWRVRVDVRGGPRNRVAPTPVVYSPAATISMTIPNRPCGHHSTWSPSFPNRVNVGWTDGSHNETSFEVYWTQMNDDTGVFGSWAFAGTVAAGVGSAQINFPPGTLLTRKRYCTRVFAKNSSGLSTASNAACFGVL